MLRYNDLLALVQCSDWSRLMSYAYRLELMLICNRCSHRNEDSLCDYALMNVWFCSKSSIVYAFTQSRFQSSKNRIISMPVGFSSLKSVCIENGSSWFGMCVCVITINLLRVTLLLRHMMSIMQTLPSILMQAISIRTLIERDRGLAESEKVGQQSRWHGRPPLIITFLRIQKVATFPIDLHARYTSPKMSINGTSIIFYTMLHTCSII